MPGQDRRTGEKRERPGEKGRHRASVGSRRGLGGCAPLQGGRISVVPWPHKGAHLPLQEPGTGAAHCGGRSGADAQPLGFSLLGPVPPVCHPCLAAIQVPDSQALRFRRCQGRQDRQAKHDLAKKGREDPCCRAFFLSLLFGVPAPSVSSRPTTYVQSTMLTTLAALTALVVGQGCHTDRL